MKNNKYRITISIDRELLKNIDNKRGDIPRSAYINKVLFNLMKGGKK